MSGAARAALRRVLQHHKITLHGDCVLEADIEAALGVDQPAQAVCSINKAHLKKQDGPWCREALVYSPDNDGDNPAGRVMLYTAGRLSDALDYAEKGMTEWRSLAEAKERQNELMQAVARIAIEHLQTILNKCRTADEQQRADAAARDWLLSIGSEPN